MIINDLLHRREHRLVLFSQFIARFFFLLAVALVPITYLPWTSEALEINKQTLLVFCSIISFLAWASSLVIQKALVVKKTWIHGLLLAFFVSVLISTIFSLAQYQSWFGSSGQEYTSLLTWGSCIIFLLVGLNVVSQETLPKFIQALLIPASIILLLQVLSLFNIVILQQNFIGAPNALGVYSTAMFALSLSALFNIKELPKSLFAGVTGFATRVSSYVIIPFTIFILYALDFWLLWALLAIAICAIFISSFSHRITAIKGKNLFLLVAILVACLLFIFVSTPGSLSTPPELAPTTQTSWQISQQTLSENSLLFGSGPGTYEINFQKYKPEVLNNSVLWDTVFNRSSSHILTMLTTMGWATVFFYLLLLVLMLVNGFKIVVNSKGAEHQLYLGLSLAWLSLAISQFFYSSDMTLQVIFWMLSAMILGIGYTSEKRIVFGKSQVHLFFAVFIGMVCALCVLTIGFLTASRYGSDIVYAKAIISSASGGSADEVIEQLTMAQALNKRNDVYARNLAYAYLYKSGELLSDTSVNPEIVFSYIDQGTGNAIKAVQLSPNVIENQLMLGDIYREITPFVLGADEFAILAYQSAIMLAPTNPKYYLALGQGYLAQADALASIISGDDEALANSSIQARLLALTNAIDAMNTALSLKSDYAPAQYYLALAYERQGNLSEAIARIRSLQADNPYDANLILQLGFLYLQQGKLDDAKTEFEYVITLSPDYSNARWFLSSVYEQQGNIEGAIEEVQKVLELNPDNVLITERLGRLQAGLVTDEVLEPLEDSQTLDLVE
ncbi:MAG: tetratricopeptide repeat protein [Patescibacteria group bacterium]